MTSRGIPRQKNSSTHCTDELIDRGEALARVDGDEELMASLVDIFLTEAAPMMEAIRSAVANGDPGKLEKAAHRLKGSISIFGVGIVAQTAFELEQQGRNRDLTQTPETMVRLEQQMKNLQLTLQKFQSELQQSR